MNNVFKALNDPTRREILELLKEKELTAGEIAEQFNMSWPSISHHLDLLKQANTDCTINSSTYAGGKIAMDMNCKMPTGTMAMKTTGTYTATSMATDAEVSMTGKTSMTQKVHTEAHRVGECS